MTNVELFDDWILIKREPLAEKTKGGLFIPDTVKGTEPKMTAKVISTGTGHVNQETGQVEPMIVKKGHRISLSTYVGQEINIDGEDLLLVRQSDVDMIIE